MARRTFSPDARRRVAELLVQRHAVLREASYKRLAAEAHVSVTTIARFAQAVRDAGYDVEAAVSAPIGWRR